MVAPIQPIAVIGAFVATDFDVPNDRRVFVAGQRARPVAEGVSRALALPVALEASTGGLVAVTILRPLVLFAVDLAIYAGEGAFGDTGAIVQRPAADDGVEGGDEGGLRRAPVAADDGLDFIQVALNGLVARFDERLDARLPPEGAGVVLPHPILPDVEAEEVEADVALVFIECMGHVGFGAAQAQPHLGQPGFGARLRFQQGRQVFAEDHEIIRVADHRDPVPSRDGGDGGLEAVQRDVGEQGGDDTPLRRACFREQEFAFVQDACLEPIAHQASERPDGVEFLEQGVVGDAVEAFLDIGVEGVLGLEADEVEDGFDGVVGGAPRAKAVGVGFELRLPFRL